MKKGTFALLVMLVIMVTIALPLVPTATWGYSGSINLLKSKGSFKIDEDIIYYRYGENGISRDELKALAKLAKINKYIIVEQGVENDR